MGYDVVALGELLIDFTGSGASGQGNPLFEANPGGAPCNVLAMLASLGKTTAFIGKVGDDMFGRLLRDALTETGIHAGGVVVDEGTNTTLAFVRTAPDGDRDFSFFRKPGADTRLLPEEVPDELIEGCRLFHFGSLSLTGQPANAATRRAVALSQKAGKPISFDPNLRPPLWGSLAHARREIDWGCGQCHILKLSQEELVFLTGREELADGAAQVRRRWPNVQLLLVTLGKQGAACFYRDLALTHPTFLEVETVDTTGAGDTFLGACLSFVLDHGLDSLKAEQLRRMLRLANAAGSLVTTKKGALRSMPTRAEVLALAGAD